MKIKSRYSVPSNVAYHYHSDMPSLTSQKFKDRVALDRIVDMSTGQLVIKDEAAFLDLYDENQAQHDYLQANQGLFDCEFNDFHTLSNMYANAKSEFEGLPSEIRRKYGDNVDNWLNVVNQLSQIQKNSVTPAEEVQKVEPTVLPAATSAEGEKSV